MTIDDKIKLQNEDEMCKKHNYLKKNSGNLEGMKAYS